MKKLFFLFVLLISISGCKKDDVVEPKEPKEPEEPQTEIELKEISYNINIPEDVTLPDATTLKLSNAYGDYEISKNTSNKSAKSSKSNSDYTSTSKVLSNGGYQLNYLVDNTGKSLMCGVTNLYNSEASYTMDATSTAISMLMTHPLLITSSKTNYNKIVGTIKSLDSFDAYVTAVEGMIKQSIENKMSIDYTDTPLYNKIIIDLINTNIENSNLSLANGKLTFDLQERKNGKLKYTITNYHKRVVHLYPKKVWVDAGGFTTKEEAFKELNLPVIDIIEPDGLNFWSSTLGLFTGDVDTYKKTTEPMEVDLGDADKLKVELYGLGKLHKDYNELTDEELLKMVIVSIHGGYQDFVKPMIDLVLGVKNLKSSGTSSQHFDFRYGSKKYPELKLIRALAGNFVTDIGEMNTFKNHIKNRDVTAMMCQFGKYSIDQILGDKQPESEKTRYLNLIYNTGKKWTGISATPDAFRDAIKKGANQISALKNASFVGQVIKIGSLAVDVAAAIYSYNDSYFREDFYVNKTSETLTTPLTPENDYVFPTDATNIDFTWDFDRGNYIGTYSFELIIEETLQDQTKKEHKYLTETTKTKTVAISDFNEHSASFEWKIIVKNSQGNVLIESDTRKFSLEKNNVNVTSVTPLQATLNTETTFTVTGTNLPEGMGFWIANLESLTEVTGGNATTRYFKGTPSGTAGTKEGVVKNAPGGNTLFTFNVEFKEQNTGTGTFTAETITIAGGTFQMGSNDGDSNEKPIHSVTLSSFSISKYEITNQQYADYMNAIGANSNGSVGGVEYLDMDDGDIQISHNGSQFVVNSGKANYPVIEVSWFGAKAYSEYYGGRLPTEAEWEFAARGGNSSNGYTYSGSNTIDEVAWYSSNSGSATHTVGTKNANELGLHDMSGNVWEWTNDWYGSNYYSSSPSSNPQGPSSGTGRVNRGGGWDFNAYYCRVAVRFSNNPTNSYNDLGFRPVFVP